MKNILRTFLALTLLLAFAYTVDAGIYSTGGNNTNSGAPDPAVSASDSRIQAWATEVVVWAPAPGYGNSSNNALGPPTSGYAILGDLNQDQINAGIEPGYIILGFATAIANGIGADFAVFENAFTSGGGVFAELAYVAVSTDGIIFSLFPSIFEAATAPVGAYGTVDPTAIYNLAGKHNASWGTPFDLDDLLEDEYVLAGLVDLNNINYVKIIDIPGSGDFLDSLGNPIYDAWVTWGSGGHDLMGVGVINQRAEAATPEPGTLAILGLVAAGGLAGMRRKRK